MSECGGCRRGTRSEFGCNVPMGVDICGWKKLFLGGIHNEWGLMFFLEVYGTGSCCVNVVEGGIPAGSDQ